MKKDFTQTLAYQKACKSNKEKYKTRALNRIAKIYFGTIIKACAAERTNELMAYRKKNAYIKLKSNPKKWAKQMRRQKYTTRIHRNDPGHLDIDWVLAKWNKRSEHINPVTGYIQTTIYGKTYQVHRLVWMEANHRFIDSGLEINHKDGNKKNNALENLEAITHKQNLIHARKILGVTPNRPRIYSDQERKERAAARLEKWYEKNKEKAIMRSKQWIENNRQKYMAYQRAFKRKQYENECLAKGTTPRPYKPRRTK